MRIVETDIPDVKLVELVEHPDARGSFTETYDRGRYQAAGIADEFLLDGQSVTTHAGTLRGLHFQKPPRAQAKLVSCVRGRVFDVAVDLRSGSPTYGRHVSLILGAADLKQIYIPEGFAHGFLTLEANTLITYKLANAYSPEHAAGVRWNDPDLDIPWPDVETGPALSDADLAHPLLKDLLPIFHMDGE